MKSPGDNASIGMGNGAGPLAHALSLLLRLYCSNNIESLTKTVKNDARAK